MTATAAWGAAGASGWTLVAATLVVAGLLLVPGWVIGRAARLGALPSLAVAPAVGSALIGAAEILAHALALTWRPWGWAAIAALTAASSLLARLVAGPASERERRTTPWSRAEWMILAGGLAVAVIVPAGAILSALPGPGYPAQAFDATFHLNAVAAIREGGNASMLGGLSALYSGRAVYYPTVWHGILALAPGGPAPVSTAGVLALIAVTWPLNLLGLLARVTGLDSACEPEADGAGRRQRVCAVAAVLALSAGVVGFPLLLMTSLAVWPYALSVLGLPGVLVLYDQLRRGAASRRLHLTLVLLALAAACGVVAAHGTGLFNLAILTLPFLVDAAASLWRRSAGSRGARALLATGVFAAVLFLGAGAWLMRSSLTSVLGYQRPAGGAASAVATLGQALIDLPMYGTAPGATVPIGIVVGLLTLAAAWSAAWAFSALLPSWALEPRPLSMPSAMVSRTRPPATRKSSRLIPKKRSRAEPLTAITAHMRALNRVVRQAVRRCWAGSWPAVRDRKSGRLTKGFIMAKKAPRALTSRVRSMTPLCPLLTIVGRAPRGARPTPDERAVRPRRLRRPGRSRGGP